MRCARLLSLFWLVSILLPTSVAASAHKVVGKARDAQLVNMVRAACSAIEVRSISEVIDPVSQTIQNPLLVSRLGRLVFEQSRRSVELNSRVRQSLLIERLETEPQFINTVASCYPDNLPAQHIFYFLIKEIDISAASSTMTAQVAMAFAPVKGLSLMSRFLVRGTSDLYRFLRIGAVTGGRLLTTAYLIDLVQRALAVKRQSNLERDADRSFNNAKHLAAEDSAKLEAAIFISRVQLRSQVRQLKNELGREHDPIRRSRLQKLIRSAEKLT